MKVDPANLDHRDSHRFMVSIVVPRPIAWVSTVDREGLPNLAPFSDFGLLSSRPPIVGIGISPKRDGQKKDTIRNIEATGEFVVNLVNESLAGAMNQTAAAYPPDVSEFKEAGLTPVKADLVKPPLVAESPISLECRVKQILVFGQPPQNSYYAIGDVVLVHVKDEILTDGRVDATKLKAIARLGGDFYCRTQDIFEMKRPD